MATEDNEKMVSTPANEEEHHHKHHSHQEHHHHHHHHHHESHGGKHVDGSERFKRHNLSAAKRRKLAERWIFILLSVLAIVVTLVCIYIYHIDN